MSRASFGHFLGTARGNAALAAGEAAATPALAAFGTKAELPKHGLQWP